MYRFSANSCATISSTAIFLSQQSRQYFSSPRGSETSFAPQSAHRDLATDFRGIRCIVNCKLMQRPTHAGLRHLALNVQRFDQMKRFYVDLLGFAVEWEPDADNVYLSSGIDNLALHRASLAAPPPAASLPETPPPAAASASPRAASQPVALAPAALAPAASPLDHLGLIVREAEDVDRWAAFLEGRGVAIDARPRTHRDGARSCYFRDPDGNSVQIIHHPPISGR